LIDLRSDFCAPPTDEMWEAMRSGTDEHVTELERRSAELLGKEAAVFTATCTMANFAGVMALGMPGEPAAVADDAHIVVNEGGWLWELAEHDPVPLDAEARLMCLENTRTRAGGTVLTREETATLAGRAERVHLDGARLANAAVALGVPIAELAAPVDTVAFSLNKGLCAPFGAVLAGDADVIEPARVYLKQVGGGTIHKAGILAAAGLVALGLVDRLADDHRRAKHLAELLGLPEPETNIVLTELGSDLLPRLEAAGVLAMAPDGVRVRLVTHRGIDDRQIEEAATAILSL
jgi:threonine aldolase